MNNFEPSSRVIGGREESFSMSFDCSSLDSIDPGGAGTRVQRLCCASG